MSRLEEVLELSTSEGTVNELIIAKTASEIAVFIIKKRLLFWIFRKKYI